MEAADVESLERATIGALAPPEVIELDGWLAPFDDGTILRARSAVPLRHDVSAAGLDRIEAAYHERGLPPAFRIADKPGLARVSDELSRRGYTIAGATVVKVGASARLSAFSDAPVRLLDKPDEAWAALFSGDGFDPADGAHRVKVLSRSPDAVYAAAGTDGETHAVGVLAFGHGWAGIHGMRTGPAHRGKGYASAILAAFGRAAQARGFGRVLLDVEESNPARRIYRAAGFEAAWRYSYWRKP